MSARKRGAARLRGLGYEVDPVAPGGIPAATDGEWAYACVSEPESDGWTCTPEALARLGDAAPAGLKGPRGGVLTRTLARLVAGWLYADEGVQAIDHG